MEVVREFFGFETPLVNVSEYLENLLERNPIILSIMLITTFEVIVHCKRLKISGTGFEGRIVRKRRSVQRFCAGRLRFENTSIESHLGLSSSEISQLRARRLDEFLKTRAPCRRGSSCP